MIRDIESQLARDEGEVSYPYLDCCGKPWRMCTCVDKGNLTIGCGRNLDASGISAKEIDFLKKNDIEDHNAQLELAFPWVDSLEDETYGVLQNMCFNMGIKKLSGFKLMLTALEQGDLIEAARELRDSEYWRCTKTHSRAERLARQLETGTWQ